MSLSPAPAVTSPESASVTPPSAATSTRRKDKPWGKGTACTVPGEGGAVWTSAWAGAVAAWVGRSRAQCNTNKDAPKMFVALPTAGRHRAETGAWLRHRLRERPRRDCSPSNNNTAEGQTTEEIRENSPKSRVSPLFWSLDYGK